MPEFFILNSTRTVISITVDRDFVGPPTGDPNLVGVITFDGFTPTAVPNVLVSTGNPHWTGHAIWVNTGGAGIVINRKTRPPGVQPFKVYFHVMSSIVPLAAAEAVRPSLKFEMTTMEHVMRVGGLTQ